MAIQVLRHEETCPRLWHVRLSQRQLCQTMNSSFMPPSSCSHRSFCLEHTCAPSFYDKGQLDLHISALLMKHLVVVLPHPLVLEHPLCFKISAHFLACLPRQGLGAPFPGTCNGSSPFLLLPYSLSLPASLFSIASVLPDITHLSPPLECHHPESRYFCLFCLLLCP